MTHWPAVDPKRLWRIDIDPLSVFSHNHNLIHDKSSTGRKELNNYYPGPIIGHK